MSLNSDSILKETEFWVVEYFKIPRPFFKIRENSLTQITVA
jgi:hypothetical protein